MDRLNKFRSEFPQDSKVVFMNNAAVSPLPLSTVKNLKDLVDLLHGEGALNPMPLFSVVEELRKSLARLINSQPEQIALMGNCASAISQIAFGLQFKRGEKIVFWDQEYPSNAFPWLEAGRRSGAEVEILKSDSNMSVNTQKLLDAIRPGVRVVALSWVQFQSGVVSPLKEIASACRRVGAYLIVDVFQGLGVQPFDFRDSGAHAVCGGSHKWLAGPAGSGFLALDEELLSQLRPILVGANTFKSLGLPFDPEAEIFPDARRFEPGAPALLNMSGWKNSINLILETGVDEIHAQALKVSKKLFTTLKDRGYEVLGNQEFAQRPSPITTIRLQNPAPIYENLDRAGIAYSPRGGGVRLSPHGFNLEREADRVLEFLPPL